MSEKINVYYCKQKKSNEASINRKPFKEIAKQNNSEPKTFFEKKNGTNFFENEPINTKHLTSKNNKLKQKTKRKFKLCKVLSPKDNKNQTCIDTFFKKRKTDAEKTEDDEKFIDNSSQNKTLNIPVIKSSKKELFPSSPCRSNLTPIQEDFKNILKVGSPLSATKQNDENQQLKFEMNKNFHHDSTCENEYNSLIVQNMKVREIEFLIGSPKDIFNSQDSNKVNVFWEWRRTHVLLLSSKIVENRINKNDDDNDELLHLAVRIFDSFIWKAKLAPRCFLAAAYTSLFIAEKCHISQNDLRTFNAENLQRFHQVNKDKLLKTEVLLLNTLKYKINMPTINTFLHYFNLNCCKNSISSSQIKETLTPKVKQNAKFLSELCLLDEELLCYEQSKIAATCLMLAMENEKHKVKLSNEEFHQITTYNYSELDNLKDRMLWLGVRSGYKDEFLLEKFSRRLQLRQAN